jgi:SAM-dependent methyltransferase
MRAPCGDDPSKMPLLDSMVAGIDISGPALAIARQELSVIRCPVTLEESDFVDALKRWTKPVDFVWVGQSLYHLETTAKRAFVRSVRRILNEDGLFLISEPTLLDGEAQEGWISRFESGSRPLWSNLTDEDWEAMLSHVRASDRPETSAQLAGVHVSGIKRLERMGWQAGRDDWRACRRCSAEARNTN